MKSIKAFAIASCLGLLAVAFLPSSKADEWNKKTILTVNEPLAVPGKVLEPGKYVMKLMDSPSDRHIVQIFNEDETQLQTTVVAIPNYRLQPADKTQFAFWEVPAGQPRALKAWFYPGDNFGQEFAYPKDLAATIAKTNNQNVPTVSTDNSTEITQTTPAGESQPMATTQQAAPNSNEPNSNGQSAAAQSTTPDTTTQSNSDMNAQNQSNNGTAASSGTASTTGQSATSDTTNSASADQNATSSSAAANQDANAGMSNGTSSTSANQTNQQTGTQANAGANLPRTASPFPLVGLGGLLSLGGALGARVLSKRIA